MTVTSEVVDAHVHVVSIDVDRFPHQPSGLGGDWWQKPNGVADLIAHLDATGVAKAVVVQAIGVYNFDCSYAIEATTQSNGRLAFVGAIDMAGDDVEADFNDLHGATTALSGVRVFGVNASGAGWLTNGAGRQVWRRAAETGVTLIPTLFPQDVGNIRPLIEEFPEVPVALDHCAFPDLGGPTAIDDLSALSDLDSLHLKVTSHNLDEADDPAAFLERLAEVFGPKRLCWGSDHPQHSSMTYSEMLALARTASVSLDRDTRSAFLGGNAIRLWW